MSFKRFDRQMHHINFVCDVYFVSCEYTLVSPNDVMQTKFQLLW